jgi:SAM-dependent methyltransferase
MGRNPFPITTRRSGCCRIAGRVLVVGAGTGNDVAAALRAGATRVDAVDIDPAIVALGRRHHPEHPYDDPRVHVIVDDARAAFRRLPAGAYGAGDVRPARLAPRSSACRACALDNYVFTRESFAEARRLLAPAARSSSRPPRSAMVPPALRRDARGGVRCAGPDARGAGVGDLRVPVRRRESSAVPAASIAMLPTDDWRSCTARARIQQAYALVVLLSVRGIGVGGAHARSLRRARFSADTGHLFFLRPPFC